MKILAIRCLPWGLILIAILVFSFPSYGFMQENRNQSPNPAEGLISVWLKPDLSLTDGIRHEIWSTGEVNGSRLVLEKSEMGMLRAVLITPVGTTVARTDISNWKSEEWHFVSVGWKRNDVETHNYASLQAPGASGSLVLWVDKIAKDGPIVPYGFSISTEALSSPPSGDDRTNRLRGDDSAPIIRPTLTGEGRYGMVACVYRDYFRTAPYETIKIDIESTRVPSDNRAVAGFEKQFGLKAWMNGRWEPVTENVVRYSQWAYFDAKPYITWSTSDSTIATIDSTGRLKALKPGKCRVIAKLHGKKDSYQLSVVSCQKPDAGVICISLSPKYRNDAVKNKPAPGDTITAGLWFGNFGTAPLPAGMKIRFILIPESTGNYKLNPEDKPVKIGNVRTDKTLQPGEESVINVEFIYPEVSTWMKLELDPGNRIDEFCEANNSIAELTDAKPIQLGYRRKDLESCIKDKKINHVGSLSYYDWLRAEKLRMDVMLREAVWPTTGPNGVEEAYRIDTFTELLGGNWDNEPWHQEANWYDGGFPVNEKVDLMAIDCAIIHEFGHTILSQPDLYGYPVKASNVFVTGDDGKPVAGSPLMPVVSGTEIMPASEGINVSGYVGYPSLMDGCQLWLHPSQAGHIMFYKGYRQDRFWGTQGRLVPGRSNWLIFKDFNDRPLKGAAVYVYHVSQAPVEDSGEKYFSNRPKFMGQTDDEGRFIFPNVTDSLWDDPETDEADGSVEVWNPFGTKVRESAFTPNVWTVEGLLLIRVVSGNQSEYHFMDLTQFNTEFLSGHTVSGSYVLNTSLSQPDKPTNVIREAIPEAIRKMNKRPVAVVAPVINVKAGEEFVIDGSRSYDPEDQPLIYRWNAGEGWLRGNVSQSAILKLKAPAKPGTVEYKFWVIDGIRCSEPARIKVNVM
ncbi:MAG: Ig-like domain-containing protein [Bacteroidales bacterium]